jgi:3-isopropylmalate dehydrogenase
MEKDYPEVTSYEFVDAVAMRLVQWPNLWCLITENLFGDILTDEASVISGSMGLMPSASVENILHYMNHSWFLSTSNGLNMQTISDSIICSDDVWRCFWIKKEEANAIRTVVKSLEQGIVTGEIKTSSIQNKWSGWLVSYTIVSFKVSFV